MGGLGNQMFQYAAARTLADRLGLELFFDVSSYKTDLARHYELDVFKIRGGVLTKQDSIFRLMHRRVLLGGIPQLQEASFRFDSNINNISSGTWIKGYFQSEKYFAANDSQIRKDFTLNSQASELTNTFSDQIKTSSCPVSLHVRRGDYVTNANANAYHGLTPISYYQQAVDIIKSSFPALHLFIFSDDPKWVSENMNLGVPQTVMKANTPDRGCEDMYLMSLCRHHVTANSSFSWWGAWLARHPEQIVIAPKTWFLTKDADDRDLIPEKWIRI